MQPVADFNSNKQLESSYTFGEGLHNESSLIVHDKESEHHEA